MNLLANLDEVKLQMSIEIIEKYSSTDYDVFEAVSLLNDSKYYQETYKVLTNEYAIKAGIALEGAKIINESQHDFNAKNAMKVLTNANAIEAGIVLDGAKIVNESQHDFNAENASIVLTNANAIKVGIALEGAKITNESQHDFNALYASRVLINANTIKAGIALDGAKIVNESNKGFNAEYASATLTTFELIIFRQIGNELILETARAISKLKDENRSRWAYHHLLDVPFCKLTSTCKFTIEMSKKENIIDELISELESDSCKNVEPKRYIKKIMS